MKIFPKIIKWHFLALLFLLLYLLQFMGCEQIKKCRPKVNPKTGYIGFYCDGEF